MYEDSQVSKIVYEDSKNLGIPESPPKILGILGILKDSEDSWGFSGFSGIL